MPSHTDHMQTSFLLGNIHLNPCSVFLKKANEVSEPLKTEAGRNPDLTIRPSIPPDAGETGPKIRTSQEMIGKELCSTGVESHKDNFDQPVDAGDHHKRTHPERKPTQADAHSTQPS